MMYVRDQYGGGTSYYDEPAAYDVFADYIQDAGIQFNKVVDYAETKSEVVTILREPISKDVNELFKDIDQMSTYDVAGKAYHPVNSSSLAGTMRGYTLEQAETSFRNHGFRTAPVASYQYSDWDQYSPQKSGASMRRISEDTGMRAEKSDFQLHVRLFHWYDDNFNQDCIDVYTHAEATPIHPLDHLNVDDNYWDAETAKKMVKHIMPQWDYTYDYFAQHNESVELTMSEKYGYPYS